MPAVRLAKLALLPTKPSCQAPASVLKEQIFYWCQLDGEETLLAHSRFHTSDILFRVVLGTMHV